MTQVESAATDDFDGLDETRNRILDAAIQCVRQYGTTKMSMADVARASKFSRATVYKYFANRQELVDAILAKGEQAFFDDLEAEMRSHTSLGDQMAAATAVAVEYLYDESHAPWAGLFDPLDEAIITQERGGEVIDGLVALCTMITTEAAEGRELRTDVDPTAAGDWLGRLIFTTHYMPDEATRVRRAQAMVRGLCQTLVRS